MFLFFSKLKLGQSQLSFKILHELVLISIKKIANKTKIIFFFILKD